MSTLITYREALEKNPEFFDRRGKHEGVLKFFKTDGSVETYRGDWKWESLYESVETGVVCNPKTGDADFGRTLTREGPHVIMVLWGKDKDDVVKLGTLHEFRPHADRVPGDTTNEDSVMFGQTHMGFSLKKVFGQHGDAVLETEEGKDAAIREAKEEGGVRVIKRVYQPRHPNLWSNPSHVGSSGELFYLEVDLEAIGDLSLDRGEYITRSEFVTVEELYRRIANGVHDGAYYRAGTSLAAWMIFLAHHPEFRETS
jgi:8-oxo-dGTP pyrophosphatase MutT (NUDIX family)